MSIYPLTDHGFSLLFLRYERWVLETAIETPLMGYFLSALTGLLIFVTFGAVLLPVIALAQFFPSETLAAAFSSEFTKWTLIVLGPVLLVPVLLTFYVIFAVGLRFMGLVMASFIALFDRGKTAKEELEKNKAQYEAMLKRMSKHA